MKERLRSVDLEPGLKTSVVLMAFFLNQSFLMFRINMSVSDVFLGIVVLILLVNGELVFDKKPLGFFILVSATVLLTSWVIVPRVFPYEPVPANIFRGFSVMLACYLYFLAGSGLAKKELMPVLLKGFSFGALLMGVMGILTTVFELGIFNELFCAGGIRFKGLMIDPNYFSVLQILSMVYFIRDRTLDIRWRRLALLVQTIAILTTGSKTGTMTLLIYLGYKLLEGLLKGRPSLKNQMKNPWFIGVAVLGFLAAFFFGDSLVGWVSDIFPAFHRIKMLFVDFRGAMTAGGSTRFDAWSTALKIIVVSPLVGIGVGNYRELGELMWDYGNVAHNTYLQWMTEWGIPLAAGFLLFLLYLLLKLAFDRRYRTPLNSLLGEMLVVIGISSLALSLNNMRLLWLILGVLMVTTDILEEFSQTRMREILRHGWRIGLVVMAVLLWGMFFWHQTYFVQDRLIERGLATYAVTLTGADESFPLEMQHLDINKVPLLRGIENHPELGYDPLVVDTLSTFYSQGKILIHYQYRDEESLRKTLEGFMKYLSERSPYEAYLGDYELVSVENKPGDYKTMNLAVIYFLISSMTALGVMMTWSVAKGNAGT